MSYFFVSCTPFHSRLKIRQFGFHTVVGWIVLSLDPITPTTKLYVPNSWNLWMSPYLETGLSRCNQFKMRSHWIRTNPNPVSGVLIKRGKFGQGYRHRENTTEPQRQRLERWKGIPKTANPRSQKQGRALTQSLQRQHMALPIPDFHKFSLHNCKTINFCCLKPSKFVVICYGSTRKHKPTFPMVLIH